jgi:hypothetical protein
VADYEAAARGFGVECRSAINFVLGDAEEFQNQLGLTWSWFSRELGELFYFWMMGRISGKSPTSIAFVVIPRIPVAPSVELAFHTRDGEPVHEAMQRLAQEVQTVQQQLLAALPPRGRVPHQLYALDRDASLTIAYFPAWMHVNAH